jgi:chemotaxis protein MotB
MGCMNQEEDYNVWPTFADIAFSILLIISLIMLAQYVVVGKFLELNRISKEQRLLSKKLKETFPSDYGKDIKVTNEPQLQKITFSDKILFDSGRTEIKKQGQTILKKVGNILNQINQHSLSSFDEIQIRGHTDDMPIVGEKLKAKFPTNWELSSGRATAVVRFFVDNCKMKSSKDLLLSAQGFSQYDYVQNEDNDFARSLNRRIEIVIKYPLNNIEKDAKHTREITTPQKFPITINPKNPENQPGVEKKTKG